MKLNILFFILFISSLSVLADVEPCDLLSVGSWEGTVAEVTFEPDNPLPPTVVQTTKTATAVSTVVGGVVSIGALGQGVRSTLVLRTDCNDIQPDTSPLSWNESPTQLSIGDSQLQYKTGAVVGNWVIFTGIAASHAALMKAVGAAESRFPGALVLPAMLLVAPTSSASTSLVAYGNAGERALGISSLALTTGATVGVAVLLSPSNFKAVLKDNKWVDGSIPGYVYRFGRLFKDYRNPMQWFVVVELATSMASGSLDGIQADKESCIGSLAANTLLNGAYFAAAALSNPVNNRVGQARMIGVAALAFSSSVFSLAGVLSENPTVKQIGSVLSTITQWAVIAGTVYDLGRQGFHFAKWAWSSFKSWRAPAAAAVPTLPLLDLVGLPSGDASSEITLDVQSTDGSSAEEMPQITTPTSSSEPVSPIIPMREKDVFSDSSSQGETPDTDSEGLGGIEDLFSLIIEDEEPVSREPRQTTNPLTAFPILPRFF